MADDRGWLESLKHYVSAPRRAFESMARPPQDPNSPVEFTTAHPLTNITRQDIDNATEAAMGVSGGGMSTKPIRAYHSSPHDFSKFDLAKIGTGEGAQVYGHGLYFAENPKVSGQGGQYWNQFRGRFPETENRATDLLQKHNFDREAALAELQQRRQQFQGYLKSGEYPVQARQGTTRAMYEDRIRGLDAQEKLLASGKPVGPRTYEVDIKADPAHMLDWDKPLKGQYAGERLPPELIEQAKRESYNRALASTSKQRADELWGMVKDPLQATGEMVITANRKFRSPETSAMLNKAGIPGIKYLDQGSRGPQVVANLGGKPVTPKPLTSNYVIFDPSILDIVKKYGLAGLAGAPAVAAATRDRDRQ